MKKINNCYYLTFKELMYGLEVCAVTDTNDKWNPKGGEFISSSTLIGDYNYDVFTFGKNAQNNFYLGKNLNLDDDTYITPDSIGNKLLKALIERYGDCYTVSYDKIYDFSDILTLPTSSEKYLAGHDQVYQAITFMNKVFNRIVLTYPKYNTLLSIYDTEASNLMDGINNSYTDTRTETTSGSSSGNNRLNDTPQDTGTFTDDTHTSSYSENESEASSSLSSTFTHTATDDVEILIDRLDKVQNKYQNLMKRWVDEFKDMFIMPVALDCEVNLNE